jgi:ribosomal subunit interface protein
VQIAIVGRHTEVNDRFRELVSEKLGKVEQLAPQAQLIDVEVTQEKNPKLSDARERVELTVTGRGPVVRAEAAAPDRVAALDLAVEKLNERLRRARDRQKNRQGPSVRDLPIIDLEGDEPSKYDADKVILVEKEEDAASVIAAEDPNRKLVPGGAPVEMRLGDSPVIIRQKLHAADRLSLAAAVEQMELVGHDFFLFIDADSGRPSAVYRRKGWTYGVIQLDSKVSN